MRILISITIAAMLLLTSSIMWAADEPEMTAVEGEHIILKLRTDDMKLLDDPKAWVDKLDRAYESLADLVGAVPFNGEKVTILSVEEHPGGWAVAGNPIKWYRKYIPEALTNGANKGDWSFGIVHEISHNFDLYLDADIGRWCWEPEFWANYKMDYVFPQTKAVIFFDGGVCDYGNPKSQQMTDIYRMHESARGNAYRMLQGGWGTDGVHSAFTDIVKEVGWESLKKVFRWYATLGPDEVSDNTLCKRSLFIRAIEEQSGVNLSDGFIDRGFTHITVDPMHAKDARETAKLFHAKDWNADVVDLPIRVAVGEKATIRIDISERNTITFKKGLGTHPFSEFVYDLGGKYTKFESIVGVVGQAQADGRWGSVGFVVEADGKKIYESPVLRGGGMYRQMSLDVTGVKELKLIVNDGGDGIWGDGCAWVDTKAIDADGKVTYVSDLKPVSLKEGYGGLHLDESIDDEPFTFYYTPCRRPVKIMGKLGIGALDQKMVEFHRGSDPEAFECTLDGFDTKGKYFVWLTINIGDSPITQHDLATIIVE